MPEPSLRIFIADEHEIVRRGMASLLNEHGGWEVCGEASDGAEAVEKIAKLAPNIVLLDIGMPKMEGLEVTRKIIEGPPFPKVILLSLTDVEPLVREALTVGARGLVIKSSASRDLVPAVEMLQQGRTFFPPHITELIVQGYLKREEVPKKKEELGRGEPAEDLVAFHRRMRNKKRRARILKYVVAAMLLAATGGILWYTEIQNSDSKRELIDRWIVRAGLKPPPPRAYEGNPNTKVWIDLHTALYYCPGSALYGKTLKGRYSKQIDAQANQFEPAARKPCD